MDLEFHFYTTYILATRAGFSTEDAQVLAYSCQLPDHSLVTYDVQTASGTYSTTATHHYGLWNRRRMENTLIPFHFFPAGETAPSPDRTDGGSNPLDVRPNAPGARELLELALVSRDLYRIGIALHTFADTWAHQNFSGNNERWNSFDPASPLPPVGHLHASNIPDLIDATWTDPRLIPGAQRVENATRFREPAREVYLYLCQFTGQSDENAELVLNDLVDRFWKPEAGLKRQERIIDAIIELDIPRYERNLWKREALVLGPSERSDSATLDRFRWLKNEVIRKSAGLQRKTAEARPGFEQSHLYRWNEAARKHLEEATRILKNLL